MLFINPHIKSKTYKSAARKVDVLMRTFAFFDTKPYDKIWFDRLKDNYDVEFKYFENKLNSDTAIMAKGCDGIVAFVNDIIDADTIDILSSLGIELITMRCAGYNNIDLQAADGRITILRVPRYSPHAIAEHAMGMILCLNRKLHRAYIRTKDFNFSLNGLTGFDLHNKTVGVIGTGKIGEAFIEICKGFGMKILAYDLYPNVENIMYTDIDTICREADIISLHCPLTRDTHHIINSDTISKMKDGVYILNTSRGALIDSEALVEGLKSKKIGGAALDVYEEESDIFFEDYSDTIVLDDLLTILLAMPNVLITSHQAFLTDEALKAIATVTLENIKMFFNGEKLVNEVKDSPSVTVSG